MIFPVLFLFSLRMDTMEMRREEVMSPGNYTEGMVWTILWKGGNTQRQADGWEVRMRLRGGGGECEG